MFYSSQIHPRVTKQFHKCHVLLQMVKQCKKIFITQENNTTSYAKWVVRWNTRWNTLVDFRVSISREAECQMECSHHTSIIYE